MFQGYLIANNATGYDQERQPWLIPDDAQFTLYDGFVYRGVWQKREGYSQFAIGQQDGVPYCESRMVHNVANEVVGAGTGSKLVFTYTLLNPPIRRGTVSVSYVIGAVTHTAVDNGLGGFTGFDLNTSLTATFINYTTGALQLTFTTAPDNATNVTVTYDSHQGLPVMGVMNFFRQDGFKELIVADTTYVNRFNNTTNRLDDISPSYTLTGNKTSFFSWVNYDTPEATSRLLFVNFADQIQQYDGSSITPYPVYTVSTTIATVNSGVVGNGTMGPYTLQTPANTGIVPFSLTITEPVSAQTVTDNGFGQLQGDGTGTVDYLTGTIVVTFNANVMAANPIKIAYQQLNTPIETALHIFQFKDRLVVQYTIENGTNFGKRIRVSGTGAFGDVFTSDAIGAGIIDMPDDSFISSSDFNRDNLLIFTQQESWAMNFTQNDAVPFTLARIDQTRGSQAPFGTITYLNRTNALSPLGLIITDSYSVDRSDDKIPDYSYNKIDQDNFNLCFAGSVDKDRDHYLIHPSPGSQTSDTILVTNYEEDNYCVYRLPLSCMGNYSVAFDVTWNNLTTFSSWDQLSTVYGNWNSFAYAKGSPISIGGGHYGEIVLLNNIETEDYPVNVRNITALDSTTFQVTTDFQTYDIGDYVAIEGAQGLTEANNKQYQIVTVIDNYNFVLNTEGQQDPTMFSTYTEGGVASKCIIFDSTTKKFNPFIETDQKVSCGWLYFYVSTTGTDLTVNQLIQGASQTNPCVLDVSGHGYTTGTQVYVDGVQGMTELNGLDYYITVIDQNHFSLDGIDATGYTAYTSHGYCSTPQQAILQVNCITNDNEESTLVFPYNPAPYQVNLTNMQSENGIKKWYKLWINQTARFIQFQVINNQSGANVQIHAMMPGFQPVGRLV